MGAREIPAAVRLRFRTMDATGRAVADRGALWRVALARLHRDAARATRPDGAKALAARLPARSGGHRDLAARAVPGPRATGEARGRRDRVLGRIRLSGGHGAR
ncbi:MAG: hypothetical protein AN485_22975, partial [Anabaena sp. MDT14b]